MGTNLLPLAVTRGDVFALPEDDYLDYNLPVDLPTDEAPVADPTEVPTPPVQVDTTPESKPNPEETLPEVPKPTPDGSEEPEELCSGKPFDAFTDLKNGSVYAFRGILGTLSRDMGHAATLSPCAGVCIPSCCPYLSSIPREVLL